jgi:predicted extracellular nuclease
VEVKLGTFNLNNLFGRFNFKASIEEIVTSGTYKFDIDSKYWIRTFKGKLVKEKSERDRSLIANRILSRDPDVLAVQEVEDKDTLDRFVHEYLKDKYPHRVVVDANDKRLIDVGIMSKLPFGAITSWQHYVHPAKPGEKVFSRDLLQTEILSADRSRTLLTLYVTHSKSKYIDWRLRGAKKEEQQQKDNELRKRQSEAVVQIVGKTVAAGSRYAIAGDLNDVPDSEPLSPLLIPSNPLGLVNLADRLEAKDRWSVRHKETGAEETHELFDYMLIPTYMEQEVQGVEVDRRKKKSGDGSDHDPVFATLSIS